MAGNSQRRGAMRKTGTKKGATVGSGGQKRQALEGRKPTPKAVDRPHHPAARRQRAVAKRADATTTKRATSRSSGRRSAGSVLVGRNPVVEALRAKIPASTLYVQTKVDADDRWREAMRIAVSMNIAILEVTKTELDRMSDGAVHQGLVLAVPEYQYSEVDDLDTDLLVVLDGVTDPRNLGAIARSAAAFGSGGIVLPTRRSVGVTASAWKASAGALSRVPVAQVTNTTRALEALKKQGFTIVGLAADADVTLGGLDREILTSPVAIVVGAEGAGLSRLVGETCDWRVSIPMAVGTESLNASVAASIVLQAVFSARS
ncbi:MAG: 23S rRNA (guanosine(2251)-2'-O)-methyltransferase RlmB [Actinomycetes bacterium]